MSDTKDKTGISEEYREATMGFLDACTEQEWPTVIIGRKDEDFIMASNTEHTDNPVFTAMGYLVNSGQLVGMFNIFVENGVPGERVVEMLRSKMHEDLREYVENNTVH